MSFYPVYDGIPNDSVRRIFGDQLAAGSAETADRVIDTRTGATAYRTGPGQWAGNLTRVLNRRALLVANRHEAVTIILSGVPADSVTYIFPMPAGEFRTAAPRMGASHSIDSVGFVYSSFHASENMRQGGDLVIDMVTRQITRRDLSVGWIGTLDSLRPGHPIIVQVNNVNTFDWTYYPGQP